LNGVLALQIVMLLDLDSLGIDTYTCAKIYSMGFEESGGTQNAVDRRHPEAEKNTISWQGK
jgi:hypothetical protein